MLVSQNKAFDLCFVHAKTVLAGIPKLSLKQGSRALLTQSCGEGKCWCGETLLMGLQRGPSLMRSFLSKGLKSGAALSRVEVPTHLCLSG